jgi:glutamate-1-semialdehyde 2,1-aminomutase
MTESQKLFQRACKHIPGGVNSPVRAFRAVGGDPVYIKRGSGSRIYDADDNEYIDFCGSWGPLALGHAHPDVVAAVVSAAGNGLSFGACNPYEVEFAELISALAPHAEMARMVNSGTEAVMTALRLARAFTGRSRIVKFDGCYHGHADYLLTAAGSGLLTSAMPDSRGVLASAVAEVISTPYNDVAALENIFQKEGDKIAAAIVEPVAGNMGLVTPESGFLAALRRLCDKYGACLVFDEVITGFRFHAGAYATLAGITPDITTFGKIVGGGMPVGVIAAKKAIMEQLAPLGQVYQAGTFSGNPITAAAGIATMKLLRQLNPYPKMERLADNFAGAINKFAEKKRINVHCSTHKGVFTVFFTGQQPLRNLAEVKSCNTDRFAAFFRHMLQRGFYLSPSQFELNFVSAAHTDGEIAAAAAAAIEFLATPGPSAQ